MLINEKIMNDGSNPKKKNIENNILEKMPNIVVAVTTSFFILSFTYNIIYFFVLGIDIGLVPLTLADYALTAKVYISSIVSIVVAFFIGRMGRENSNQNIPKVSLAKKIGQILFLLILVVLCLFVVCMNLYQAFSINIYHINPMLGLIVMIPLFYFNRNNRINILLLFSILMLFYFVDITKKRMVNSFLSNNYYLDKGNKKYKLLRTFEQGFLVADKDYHVSFLYLDGESKIEFQSNEEIIKYLNSLKKES